MLVPAHHPAALLQHPRAPNSVLAIAAVGGAIEELGKGFPEGAGEVLHRRRQVCRFTGQRSAVEGERDDGHRRRGMLILFAVLTWGGIKVELRGVELGLQSGHRGPAELFLADDYTHG